MCSRNNPIALALKRLGYDLSVGYRGVYDRKPATTVDGMAYFVAVPVTALPESAVGFMRAFGYSTSGKESKRSFQARKRLRRTSSDHKKPVVATKQGKSVEPFEFELELDQCS
jgi:hypothetical protein